MRSVLHVDVHPSSQRKLQLIRFRRGEDHHARQTTVRQFGRKRRDHARRGRLKLPRGCCRILRVTANRLRRDRRALPRQRQIELLVVTGDDQVQAIGNANVDSRC